jgi:hypothetical protein
MADNFDIMISEFLDGGENGKGSSRLGEMLVSDKKLRKEFLDQCLMHQLLNQYFSEKKAPTASPPAQKTGWFGSMLRSVHDFLRFAIPSSN